MNLPPLNFAPGKDFKSRLRILYIAAAGAAMILVPSHPAPLPPPPFVLVPGRSGLLELGHLLLVGGFEVGQKLVVLRHNIVHLENEVVKGCIIEFVEALVSFDRHWHKCGKAAKGQSSQENCSPHPKPRSQ